MKKRQTARDYAICRVERMDSETATERQTQALQRHVRYETEQADVYEAEARILEAWAAGTEASEADLSFLRSKPRGGVNYYTQSARNRLEVLRIEFQRRDVFKPQDYRNWAAKSREAAAKAREALETGGTAPARIVAVTWHHRLDLAQKVAQIDPRTTVSFLPATRA